MLWSDEPIGTQPLPWYSLLVMRGVPHGVGSTVTEICVGTGPCGELRYPAYQEKGGKWSYFGAQQPSAALHAMVSPRLIINDLYTLAQTPLW